MDLCWQSMSLLFTMLSRLAITFLLSSKHLLLSWLQSPSALIFEPPKKVSHCFQPAFSLSSFTFIKRLFSSSSLSAYLRLLIFLPAILIPACASSSTYYALQRKQRSKCQHPLDHRKSKGVPEKHLLLYWLHQSLWLCESQPTVKNS